MAEKNRRMDQGSDRHFTHKRAVIHQIKALTENFMFNSAGLAIKAVSSALVKAGSLFYALANGKLVTKPANTDMAPLSGTVTNAKFNVFVFTIDESGNLKSYMGTEGASLAAVSLPEIPLNETVIGFVIINPTGTGDFVGGTTALDSGTVVPNAVYVNVNGGFRPNVFMNSADQLSTE